MRPTCAVWISQKATQTGIRFDLSRIGLDQIKADRSARRGTIMSLPIAKSLWNTKQRQGHSLHRICPYQGSFPPQLPAFFLDKYDGKVVLDPFCGRGTVILEAALRKRRAIGFDMLATARALSRVKVKCDARSKVLEEIAALNLNQNAPNVPADFENLYHPKTWGEVWSLKQSPRSDALTALTLGRLHGHSPGFFSGFTFNVISLPPASLERLRLKHNSELPYRDVK
ncbi:MAG: DNA methyltransferase, partial [Vicinamibacterales bacterium]|nr:DNA methyltransferase [Vicinamibacterales bacterium]